MKKNFVFLVYLLAVSNILLGQSKIVREWEIESAATNWIKAQNSDSSVTITSIVVLNDSNESPLIYEATTDSITILFSGTRNCIPIIGYCGKSESSIVELYERKELPCGMQLMMDDYVEQIKYAYRTTNISSDFIRSWNQLVFDSIPDEMRTRVTVGPLLTTLWGQKYPNMGNPEDAYNYYAPPGDTCNHCYAGCTAVATAQIMNYWTCPVLSQNIENQIDWCNMSDILNTEDESYEIKRNAVAHLISLIGQYSYMTYGCGGSNASLQNARNALVNIFNYSSDAHYTQRRYYRDPEWVTLLSNHINWGFPVLYAGYGLSGMTPIGHSFVCDGYNNNGYFHFNWGYPEHPEYNGYFSIDQLTPGNINYNWEQEAVFYIHPDESLNMCNVSLNLEDYYLNNANLLFNHPYNITPQTMTNLISASASSPEVWRKIPYGATATYQAHEEILLRDGFAVEEGADFTAQIVPCPNCETRDVEATVDEESERSDMTVESDDAETILNAIAPTTDRTMEFTPNPTSGEVAISMADEVQSIVIYNAQGRPVGGWKILSIAGNNSTIDVSTLPAGPYLVRITTPSGTVTKKLLVQRR